MYEVVKRSVLDADGPLLSPRQSQQCRYGRSDQLLIALELLMLMASIQQQTAQRYVVRLNEPQVALCWEPHITIPGTTM